MGSSWRSSSGAGLRARAGRAPGGGPRPGRARAAGHLPVGRASELIGVDRSGPIDAWIPMFLFAIVFGLSMDYEVFLLSRIKEEYDRSVRRGQPDNNTAVADGLALTARVITAAALIMFCVFGAFV